MAREESDREDLLREATALVERVELHCDGHADTIVVGFRRNGAMSVVCGADPVFQFNAAGELRRAYAAGRLLKAEQGRLIELTRVRTPDATQLVRRELDAAETAVLLQTMTARLTALRDALTGSCVVVGEVPPGGAVVDRVRRALPPLCESPRIAAAPHVG